MGELDLDTVIIRGEAVARFLNDDVIQLVFSGLDEAYYRKWKAADTPEQREELRAEARALESLNRALLGFVEAGTLAKRQVEQRDKVQ